MKTNRTTQRALFAPSLTLALLSCYTLADSAEVASDNINTDIYELVVTGAYVKEATAVAPTQASLKATQPQSIITRDFIELAVAPTAEYSRIVNVAPSLSGDSANGPGLSETKTTLRGFSDDQYNITFDGIPWGDTNNPAHHSTSFFPGSTIGGAVVERGPGNASNMGYATFGGSINLFSKKPAEEMGGSVFTSFGNWNTRLLGGSFESGQFKNFGNTTVQLNIQQVKSDGYLTYNTIDSTNYMIKVQSEITDNTVMTIFSTKNTIDYVQPDNAKGPTLAQIALYGKNFSLNNDPASFNFKDFNYTHKNTDFSYLRLESDWGDGWTSDNQLYTYAYDNQTISSTDPTGATAPGTKAGVKGNKNIPGIDKQNAYRVRGDIFKLNKEFSLGTARLGVWYETSDTDRHNYDLDLTLGKIPDPRETKPAPVQNPAILFDQQSTIKTVQPFAEFEWKATDSLSITPGVKAVSITRSVNALVNQTTRLPQHASVDFDTTLPFLTVNQQFSDSLAGYAQYAKGFQIPDLKSFYITDPTKNSSEPQLSTNKQIGIVGKASSLTWDVDIYTIDFTNKYVSNGLGGNDAAYVNLGGVTYKGVEGQLTYVIGNGFSFYTNGSINKAKNVDTDKTIANAPDMTAALGVLFNSGSWASSLIYKRTGGAYQSDYDATKPTVYDDYKTNAYNNLDLGVAYTLSDLGSIKRLKLQMNIFNLLDSQEITAIAVAKNTTYNQYIYQATRSFQLSTKADF